jgi:spore photoproduct lyase
MLTMTEQYNKASIFELSTYLAYKKQGVSKSKRTILSIKENGRSTDFIAPDFAIGCELACTYCYVARHRPIGNSLEKYTNLNQIWSSIYSHWLRLSKKSKPNQCDPLYWTYDIGEATDCMSPKNIDDTNWLISNFQRYTDAKPSFATKLRVSNKFNKLYKKRMARVRISVAPQPIIDALEPTTSSLKTRLQSINKLVDLGYEVHLNFSPVTVYFGWVNDYTNLMKEIDAIISDEVKQQLKSEVTFLTHSVLLHNKHQMLFPSAENMLWTPRWQESKATKRGDNSVVLYSKHIKSKLIQKFKEISNTYLPYCKIRYIF